jgi:serine/threonine protein kinase
VSSSESLTVPPSPSPASDLDLSRLLLLPQGPDELGRLGNYRVLGVLGQGGMGVVFQAEDVQLRRRVALKAMLPGIAASASNRQRFLREAQAAAAIEHDHVVPIYQVGEDNGIPYLAMPLLKGESLNDRLQREGRLPVADVLRIGRETAEGLAAAHGQGLIHRDIKPANLWLESLPGEPGGSSPRYRVKILDFGLARVPADSAQLTQSGVILGTPAFMAPEQAAGKPVDARCDLFSLGCVLYRLCTGELPFKGADSISTLMAVAMEHPRPPRDLDPAVPHALSDLILRLLAKSPDQRPPSALAARTALAAIERGPVAEAIPVVDVLPVYPAALPVRDDETIPVLERATPVPEATVRERERLLTRTVAAVVAAAGGIVGAVGGAVVAAATVGSAGVGAGFIGGGASGAVLGWLLGMLAGGAYVGYLTAEAERRREEKRRRQIR